VSWPSSSSSPCSQCGSFSPLPCTFLHSFPLLLSLETNRKVIHCVQSLCHGRIVCVPSRPPIALGRVQLQVLPRCGNCFRTSFFRRYRRGTSLPLLKSLRSVADLMGLRCTDSRRCHSVNLSNINLYFCSLFSVRFIVCRIHPTLSFLHIPLHHHLKSALYNLFLSPSFSLNSLLHSKATSFFSSHLLGRHSWNDERRESVIERDCCTRDTREDRFRRKTHTRTDSFQLVLILKLESFSTDMILTPPALAFTLNYAFLSPSLFFTLSLIPCKPRFPPSNPSL